MTRIAAVLALIFIPLSLIDFGGLPRIRTLNANKKRVVHIRLSRQSAVIIGPDGLVQASSPVCTGKLGRETPKGEFQVTRKVLKHRSSQFGRYLSSDGTVLADKVDRRKYYGVGNAIFEGVEMNYFIQFHYGIGMHHGAMESRPASQGCVRLPEKNARDFYSILQIGDVVRVTE